MIGIVRSSLPEARNLSAGEVLDAAARQGLGGVLFNSLHDISPTLDPAEMQAVRRQADALGLYLSAGLGVVNPALPTRGRTLIEAGGGDLEAGVRRLIGLAADIGINDMFFVIGMIEDRFSETVSWQAQRDAVAALILRCAPLLRQRRSRLLIKTHEEITTAEIVALVERVGTELLGVAFDPVNVVCRLEDPVRAARRVGPYTAQVHVDDAVLAFEGAGIRRFLCPLGEGEIDWAAIGTAIPGVRRWIEMHSGQFAMPVFDPQWLALQPAVDLTEFAAVLAMASRFGNRAMSWDQAAPTSRLAQACERLFG